MRSVSRLDAPSRAATSRHPETAFPTASAISLACFRPTRLAPLARDLGHVDEAGKVLPPFRWDDNRRLNLRAKLDALYFHLYGVTDRADIRYLYSTFPIVEREETAEYGTYRSRDLALAWANALAAGNPDAAMAP
ncbi:MAG: hypothetical protein OXR82_17375 [Gammaproteobacteria bacterium]|nr:hypothetical protein [Gammaproteobacteria bacterium]